MCFLFRQCLISDNGDITKGVPLIETHIHSPSSLSHTSPSLEGRGERGLPSCLYMTGISILWCRCLSTHDADLIFLSVLKPHRLSKPDETGSRGNVLAMRRVSRPRHHLSLSVICLVFFFFLFMFFFSKGSFCAVDTEIHTHTATCGTPGCQCLRTASHLYRGWSAKQCTGPFPKRAMREKRETDGEVDG